MVVSGIQGSRRSALCGPLLDLAHNRLELGVPAEGGDVGVFEDPLVGKARREGASKKAEGLHPGARARPGISEVIAAVRMVWESLGLGRELEGFVALAFHEKGER